MELIDILAIASRWVHLLSVVVAVGGATFARFVLMPAAQSALTPETRTSLHTRLVARWRNVVRVCVGLIVVSGTFNFYQVFQSGIKPMPYHALFGGKLILAFAVFFLALVLSGSGPVFAGFRKDGKRWSTVLVSLAVLAIMASGVLRWIRLAAMTSAPS